MAKRFIDTNIFRKEFIRGLDAPHKLLWIYIINECDHAGLWDVEIDVAQARLGLHELTIENALKAFDGKIVVINNGSKWFIPDFIEFQYGELKIENRAHNSVIQILTKYKLFKNKPLTSPLQGAMDKDMDMDKEKDKDMEGEGKPPKDEVKPKSFVPNFDSYPTPYRQGLKDWWGYKVEKKQKYTQMGWDALVEKALKMNAAKFSESIKNCMANNWAGLHEPKTSDTTPTQETKRRGNDTFDY